MFLTPVLKIQNPNLCSLRRNDFPRADLILASRQNLAPLLSKTNFKYSREKEYHP